MAHQSRYHPSNNLHSLNGESFGHRMRDDNENDELRGVIDDLTVENKKLKHLLRNSHTRSSPASSSPDRVLEVRMHGLAPEKKRELEQLLKSFATSLTDDTPSASIDKSASNTDLGLVLGQKSADPTKTNTDSGYASISNSGLNSSSHSGGPKRDSAPKNKKEKDKDIKNYLHDIPDSVFAREVGNVDENAKMVLVVQRLEQLFTGKRADPGVRSLPLQQQRISRSAAKEDQREDQRLNRAAKVEGLREAHILPPDSKVNFDTVEPDRHATGAQQPEGQLVSDLSSTDASELPTDRATSPDQRPTRPLDLDIHRAQVAAENIEYIRHLGLSSPRFEDDVEGKDQPWLYLNLLVSMAQLHTLNVTPAFVRKALKQLSTKFELSKDGHRVRWKGRAAQSSTANIQASPMSATQRNPEDTGEEGGRRSRRSATSTINDQVSMSVSDEKVTKALVDGGMVNSTATSSNFALGLPSNGSKSTSAFDYKPIVYKGQKNFPNAHNSYLDSSGSDYGLSSERGGLAHAPSRSSLKPKDDAREGFMTFFSNPYFFTDLSCDKTSRSARANSDQGAQGALGIARMPVDDDEDLRDADACCFSSVGEKEQRPWPEDCPKMVMDPAPVRFAGEYETQPIELPASGIGGVRPEDNFALDVKVVRTQNNVGNAAGKGEHEHGVSNSKVAKYSYRTQQCTRLNLQPPRLPSPNYIFFTSSSSSTAEKGFFYDGSSSQSSEAENSPAAAGFLWQWSSSSNERQVGDDELSDCSSSLGVLEAARARLSHGDTINEAGRTMSGSLAATVGASWSAASAVDPATGHERGPTSSEMSLDFE